MPLLTPARESNHRDQGRYRAPRVYDFDQNLEAANEANQNISLSQGVETTHLAAALIRYLDSHSLNKHPVQARSNVPLLDGDTIYNLASELTEELYDPLCPPCHKQYKFHHIDNRALVPYIEQPARILA